MIKHLHKYILPWGVLFGFFKGERIMHNGSGMFSQTLF